MTTILAYSILIIGEWDRWQRRARPAQSAWERDPLGVIVGFIILAIGLWWLFKIVRFFVRRIEEVSKEREQGRLQKEKKNEEIREDKKFDRIINCPFCEGTGVTGILSEVTRYGDGSYGYEISIVPKDRSSSDYRNNDETSYELSQGNKCPYCNGLGTAYARFEKIGAFSKKCDSCGGNGRVPVKVKLEIGVGTSEIPCKWCNGAGTVLVPEKEVVHVKTVASLNKKPSYAYDYYDATPQKCVIELNSLNREFYAKSRPIT